MLAGQLAPCCAPEPKLGVLAIQWAEVGEVLGAHQVGATEHHAGVARTLAFPDSPGSQRAVQVDQGRHPSQAHPEVPVLAARHVVVETTCRHGQFPSYQDRGATPGNDVVA